VDKVTDVSATITPNTIVLVAGYMIGIAAATTDGEGPLSVAASLFPLSALLVMPIRWAGDQVPTAHLVLAMIGTAVTAGLLAALASTVYWRALLITGRRARLRDVVGAHAAG
jgi:ABC-2 type transport system permease protein